MGNRLFAFASLQTPDCKQQQQQQQQQQLQQRIVVSAVLGKLLALTQTTA
jgi:hypothetical protein